MAKTKFIQNSFTSGVLSPLLKGRADIEQYFNGLETGENIVILPQGGLKRRPGTSYVGTSLPKLSRNTTAPTMPNGGTAANINDDDDTTIEQTTTNIGTVNPYVVAQYDLGADTYIEVADLRAVSLTSGSSTQFGIQYSTNGSTWIDALNPSKVFTLGTASQNFRFRLQRTARYFRFVRIGSTDLGTAKVNIGEFNLWEKTSTLSEVKLKDFSVSTDKHYLFEITDGNCRIYLKTDNSYKADIKVPLLSSEVKDIRDVQSEKVILLFHEEHETLRIINLDSDEDWFQDTAPYINVPQFDYNDSSSPTPVDEVQVMTFTAFVAGDQFQIDVESVLSKNITFAGDSTADEQSATAENIRKNLQDMPVFGATGVAVARTGALTYTITISGESTKAFELFSAFPTSGTASKSIAFTKSATGSPRSEDVWSDTRGWPRSACYYDGRLVIGGTKSKPQSIFTSKAGSAFDFDVGEGDDDEAVFVTISSRELSEIQDVFPGRNLQVFTAGSEFAVLNSPITPQTFNVVPQTSHGSLNLEAKDIDGATVFIDRNGKTLREYIYNFNEDAYIANDISVLSPELINQPVDVAILGGTTSEDANWIFIVNQDGTGTVLNKLRSQDINGFTKWTTDGEITDVSVVDDSLYMATKRTINGTESYYLEMWDFDMPVDSGVSYSVGGLPFTTILDLEHLEGESVRVVGDGCDLGNFTVSSGQITLDDAVRSAQVGIAFTPTFKPMPVATNAGGGSNQLAQKKIIRMNLLTYETTGIYIDGNQTPVRQFGDSSDSPLDTPPNQTSGIIEDVLNVNGWGRDVMPTFTQPDAMPFTILAVEYEVESS